MNVDEVQIKFYGTRKHKRLLDWIAAERVKRDGIHLGSMRGYRSQVMRELIEREAARLETEKPGTL